MIVAAAFCPTPPVLVPEVAQSAAPELDELRAACRMAVARVAGSGAPIAVLGAADEDRIYAAGTGGSLAGFGVDVEAVLGAGPGGADPLPLALTLGAWLLPAGARRTACAVGVRSQAVLPPGDWALLVMGDGSARRSTAAPGYLDERAEPYDAAIARALAEGDGPALARDADGLLAAGAPVWRAVSGLLDGPWDAELLYEDAPYGVGYHVAVWTRPAGAPAR